ncbi:zinc-binding dehydrogenase [Tateyamaria pelophila]|uniref:zinc-binding dehydrogenase n=1 Tax=Tateyamaria pelophila TaxID=328415 RepID=UPI001CC015B3|nr:zinc-binding dehydrogenase [Tateyamaria pelophila]
MLWCDCGVDCRSGYENAVFARPRLTGSTVIPQHIFKDLVGYVERGAVRPLLAATYPLVDLRRAQQAFIEKRHVGNIVVTP